MLTALREWSQKRTLRTMLRDPRSARGFRSVPTPSQQTFLAAPHGEASLPNTARLGARRFADLVLPRQFGRVSDAQYPPHPAPMIAASLQGTGGNG